MTDLTLILAGIGLVTIGLLVGLLLGDPSARRRTPPPLSPPALPPVQDAPPAPPLPLSAYSGWLSPSPAPAQPQWDAKRVTSLALADTEPADTSTATVPALQPVRPDSDAETYGRHHKPGPAPIERTQVIAAYAPRTKETTP